VLAAIIEVVSGQTYPQFTTQRLFNPAGMNDTGFFGQPVPEDRIAVGYGRKKSSEPNSPQHWGPTSWLVMGSGGQVSTLGDMLRWEQQMKSGKILSPESRKLYQREGDGLSMDGDDFGFEFMHSRNPDQLFMLITNTSNQQTQQQFKQLGLQLYKLVSQGDSPAKYSLGIAMAVSSHNGVTVQRVAAGSVAEKDGLRVGDRLISANGEKFGQDPMDVLDPFLQSGTPIEFEIVRDDQALTLRVTPLAKH
jgi:CubicO group peptidase (beta-lactamase class C family)